MLKETKLATHGHVQRTKAWNKEWPASMWSVYKGEEAEAK